MKRVEVHEAALREAKSAYRWYAAKSEQAARGFDAELYRTFQTIGEHPERFSTYMVGTRYLRLHRFPYLVVYLDESVRVHVIAVAHAKRRPRYWSRRIR